MNCRGECFHHFELFFDGWLVGWLVVGSVLILDAPVVMKSSCLRKYFIALRACSGVELGRERRRSGAWGG